MPEFEEDNANASQSETYTPSTDASSKPRTRRRSGGFKTEVAPISNAKMGEVDPAQALKEEKLSGQPSPTEPRKERAEKPARSERAPRKDRSDREPRQKREDKSPRRDANPQPSAETLAAIASVEAKIAERRAERDARRAERNKNRPAKSGGKTDAPRSGGQKPTAKTESSEGGLIAAIGGFFGKLFGSEPEPAPKKKSGNRGGPNRGGRPQGKGGNRGGQNRRRGGKGGNRGGQGNRRGGKGQRRNNETVAS